MFEAQFKESNTSEDFFMLNCIPTIVTENQKEDMDKTPTEEEVKEVVFSLNSESACGVDGLSGKFFQY